VIIGRASVHGKRVLVDMRCKDVGHWVLISKIACEETENKEENR